MNAIQSVHSAPQGLKRLRKKGRMKSESGKRKKQGLKPDSFC